MTINFPGYIILIAGLLSSFAITFFGIPSIIKIARIKNLFDLPGDRTSHIEPTPRLGGTLIFAGVILSSILFTDMYNAPRLKYIIAGMLVLFFIGIKDDIISLSLYKKIIGQLCACLILIIPGNIRIIDFYGISGVGNTSYVASAIVTLSLLMVLINSMNLTDGIDGLAAGIGIVASIVFGILFTFFGELSYAVMSYSLTGSLLAFFWYNSFSKKNKIFLGDTGSMIIGFLLAVFAIHFLKLQSFVVPNNTVLSNAPALTFAILVFPLFDTFRIIVIRLFNKRPVFQADSNHLHHLVLKISKTHLRATVKIIFVNILIITLTYIFRSLGNIILIASIFLTCTLISVILHYYIKKSNLTR